MNSFAPITTACAAAVEQSPTERTAYAKIARSRDIQIQRQEVGRLLVTCTVSTEHPGPRLAEEDQKDFLAASAEAFGSVGISGVNRAYRSCAALTASDIETCIIVSVRVQGLRATCPTWVRPLKLLPDLAPGGPTGSGCPGGDLK